MYYDTNLLRTRSERLEGFEWDRGQTKRTARLGHNPIHPQPPTHSQTFIHKFSPLPPKDPNEMCKTKHVSRDNTSSFCYIAIEYLRDIDFLGVILDTML